MANRFKQLLARIPRGSFYDSSGTVIPYRGTSPYEFLLEPLTPLRAFRVFVNDTFRGTISSDVGGTLIVRVILDAGRQDIVVVDTVTNERFPTYVDVRVFATVLASHAETIEGIDTQLDEVQKSLVLETATSRYIEDVFGRGLRQPNSLTGWLLESYRRLLRWLRQAFRTYGSKLLGLRQTVAGFTSALPLRIPFAWRPRWVLGAQLMPNGDVQEHARLTASPLTNLNIESADFVHVAFGGGPLIFPGPFTSPPEPQPLQVAFAVGWNGGTVTVNGTDPLGNVLAETFTPLAAQPLVAAETVVGLQNYATVTSATKGAGAGGTAAIGVSVGRFVKLVSFNGLNQVATSTLLFKQAPGDVLSWAAGAPPSEVLVDVSATSPYLVNGKGRVTLRSPDQPARWFSYVDGGAGPYAVLNEHFLAIEADDKGVVLIDLTDPLFGGGASPRTTAEVATSINTYFGRDPRYGANKSTGSVQINSGATGFDLRSANAGAGQTVVLNDGVNPAVTFRFRLAGFTGGEVSVHVLDGDTAAQCATKLAAAVLDGTDGASLSTLGALRMQAAANWPSSGYVSLENDFGGTQGNQLITELGGFITVISSMTGGSTALPYSIMASSQLDVSALQQVVRLYISSIAAAVGPSASFRIHPVGADASLVALGLPLTRAFLSAALAMRAVNLPLTAASRFASVPEQVEIISPFVDDATPVVTGAFAMTRTSALEVYFDASWRGPAVTVVGLNQTGALVSEVFTPPSNVVKSGTVAAVSSVLSGDGVTVVCLNAVFTHQDVGRFLRLKSGPLNEFGAYIESVPLATTVRLTGLGVGAAFAAADWVVTEFKVVQGSVAFTSVSQASHPLAVAGTPSGTATVFLRDGRSRGYDVRVGRGLRLSGGVSAEIIPSAPTYNTATFDTGGLRLLKSDAGGYVLVSGSTVGSGTNNGLHKILSVLPQGGGLSTCFIQHQDHDRGGVFTYEMFGPGTWRLYSPGEILRVIRKNGATQLIPYPPSLVAPRPSGALVELADELPLTARGWEGVEELVVDVDRDYRPTPPVSDALTLSGTKIPDGWRAYNYNDVLSTGMEPLGQVVRARLLLFGTGTDVDKVGAQFILEKALPVDSVLVYRGFVVRVSFWLQQHSTVSANMSIDIATRGGPMGAGAFTQAGPVTTLTDSGANFPTSVVGQRVDVRNATTGANNGTFTVTARPTATSIEYTNATGVAQVFAAGTTYNVFGLGAVVPGSVSASPEPVPGTGAYYASGGGPLDVHLVEAQVELPYDADRCVVRLVMNQGVAPAPPGAIFSVERCVVRVTNAQGMFLGTNTIPRSAKRAQFGEVLYVWSSEPLVTTEKTSLGIPDLPASTVAVPGQIDNVVNAHGYWERFDVSEYSSGLPVNIKGAYDESAWGAAVLSNMEVVVGTPPRVSVVKPTKVSLVEGERLVVTAPSNAVLAETSAHEAPFPDESFTDERLYEDGLPVPATPSVTGGVLPWRFTGVSGIQIASVAAGDPPSQAVYNSGATYTIDYRRLTRATPAVIDLGATFVNYLWLVDAAIYRRGESSSTPFSRTQQLTFLSNYQSTLLVRSDQNQTTATLTADNGTLQTSVPVSNWRFIDAQTIEINASTFDSKALYSLSYTALEPQYRRLPLVDDLRSASGVVIEARSGTSAVATAADSWRVVAPDEVVNRAHQYHQLRVTVAGVVVSRVQNGSGTADVNGRVVTLNSGTFQAGVKVDRVFKILSGAAAGKMAHIVRVGSGLTSLSLDADLGVFPSVDWEVRTFLHGTDIEVAGLGLRGINLYGTPPSAPGIIVP